MLVRETHDLGIQIHYDGLWIYSLKKISEALTFPDQKLTVGAGRRNSRASDRRNWNLQGLSFGTQGKGNFSLHFLICSHMVPLLYAPQRTVGKSEHLAHEIAL